MPSPAEISWHGGGAVFFVKVEHAALGGRKAKKGTARGNGDGKRIGKDRFADPGDPGNTDKGMLIEEVLHKPLGGLNGFGHERF